MAKTDGKAKPAKIPQNIDARSGTFTGVVGIGLLSTLLAAGLGFGYIIAVESPRREALQVEQISATLATQEATAVHHFIQRLRERVAGAARSPLAMQSIATQADTDISLVEKAMLDYFPEASSLRILPLGELGTAIFADGNQGLRNHIEVDLVRRASQAEATQPESFEFEGRWLTSMAQVVKHPRIHNRKAVILVTIDNQQLSEQLQLLEPAGSAVLEQLYTNAAGKQLTQTIARAGSAGSRGKAFVAHAPLPETRWQVAFTPGDALLDSLAVDRAPLYTATALGLAGAGAGVLLAAFLYRRRVRHTAERLISIAESRSRESIALPELVSLGRQLRRATRSSLSRDTTATAGPEMEVEVEDVEEVEAPGNSSPEQPRGLLYQSRSLLDSDAWDDTGEVLELDLDEPLEDTPPEGTPVADDFPEHVFRAYDIRGDADTELTNELIYRLGRALGERVAGRGDNQAIVGGDGRLSTPRIRGKLIEGLSDSGIDVIDIGLVPTPLLYYAIHHLDCNAGFMVTGSHNPAGDNGLKIVLDRHTIAAGGIQELRQRVATIDPKQATGSRGKVSTRDISGEYIDEVAGDIAIAVPLRIVIDASNGATGEVAPRLFRELGCEVITLNCDIDGHFPGHPPDTSDERNLGDLAAAVLAKQADFGVAFDGDGDRVAVVTGSGQFVRADTLLMVFAQDVVSRNPGADVVFDVKCSRNLARLITRHGGRPVLWKTGHAYMKQKIAETGALLGGEFSGHVFFGERWYGHDDGMYAAGRLAEILGTHDCTLDEALADFPRTVNTPELRVSVPEQKKFSLIQKIAREADFDEGKLSTLDGIRVDFDYGWGLLRASNTSAALTARFEAETEEQLENIKQMFRDQVARVEPDLQLPF